LLIGAPAVGAVDGDTDKEGDDVVVDVVEAEPPVVVDIASAVVVLKISVEFAEVVVVVVELLLKPAIKVGVAVGPDV
jgi:hypothetical protein